MKHRHTASRTVLFLGLFAALQCAPSGALSAQTAVGAENSPSGILARSRTIQSDQQASALLEKSLSAAGSLRPWFLLELTVRSAGASKWKDALAWAEKMDASAVPEEIADSAVWWRSEALRMNGKSEAATSLLLSRLEMGKTSDPALYLSYFRAGSSRSAELIGRFDAAFPQMRQTDADSYLMSRYLAGLCAVREGDWETSLFLLSRFAELSGDRFPEYRSWAYWYQAYSLYRLGKFEQSTAAFTDFLGRWRTHPYGWQAAMTGSLAALQASLDPLPLTEQALSLAPNGASLAEAALLRASILMDRKDDEKAEALLTGIADGSSTKGRTASSPRALFMLAEIASRARNPELAEERWLSLASSFPKDALAEESIFRAGENWYIAGNLPRSLTLFTRYRQTWISGKYLDSVLRNGGDAHSRTGSVDLAILWWEDLVRKYPDSPAIPRAYAELVSAYRKKHEYDAAIWTAEAYRSKYPAESALDDMESEIAALNKLKNGENPDSASLYVDWTRASRASTASGRSLGLRLARAYLEDYGKRPDAEAVLSEITKAMPANTDRLTGPEKNTYAASWALLGALHRDNGNWTAASADFLKAGTLYASTDGERAAEALYGAADCFLQSGKPADAESALKTLQSSWPESVWTRRASMLLDAALQEKGSKR